MKKGIIKEFFPTEQYGFITDEEGEDYFFHIKNIHPKSKNKKIVEGKHVAFDVDYDFKGDKAINVRILD
jgi:cold shock CspA family protein